MAEQKLRRQQKEQTENERICAERERQKVLEEEESLDKARKTTQQQQQKKTGVSTKRKEKASPPNDANANSPVAIPSPAIIRERAEMRRLEQEKRRRQVRESHIDLNRQRDIMAEFEKSL